MIRERIQERHGPHERRCLLLLPEGGQADRLIIVLHGCGGTASWMAVETALEERAREAGIALAFPEATRANMNSPAHFMANPPCWEDGAERHLPKPAPGADDSGWITSLAGRLSARLGLRRLPVLAGFSNGAGMIAAAIVRGGAEFGGAAFVCGYPRRPPPGRIAPVPSLFLMGGADPLVPWEGGSAVLPWHPDPIFVPAIGERAGQWAAAMGARAGETSFHSHPDWDEWIHAGAQGHALVTVRRVRGLGHHWPGGRGQWSDPASGNRRDDLAASEMILEHFGLLA